MNVLVIGATGLLGGRIAEYLSLQGHRVILGIRDPEKKSYFDFESAEILLVDLESVEKLKVDLDGIDLIIYVAGLNSVDSQVSPSRSMIIKSFGTKKIIDAAVRFGVKKFIYISSVHVYKNPLLGVFDETSPLLNDNIYALSHLAGEDTLIRSICSGEIDGLILRVSNGFGRPVDKRVNCWSLLANDLCRKGVEDGALILRGDGSSIRNYISISEICRAINFCIDRLPLQVNDKKTLIANLGGKLTLTTLEVANIIRSRFIETKQIALPIFLINKQKTEKSISNIRNSLVFKNNVLERLGYLSSDDFFNEIDELIDFCHKNFILKKC